MYHSQLSLKTNVSRQNLNCMTFLQVSHAFLRQCFAQFILQQASQSEIQLSEMQLLCMNGGLELLPQRC